MFQAKFVHVKPLLGKESLAGVCQHPATSPSTCQHRFHMGGVCEGKLQALISALEITSPPAFVHAKEAFDLLLVVLLAHWCLLAVT